MNYHMIRAFELEIFASKTQGPRSLTVRMPAKIQTLLVALAAEV